MPHCRMPGCQRKTTGWAAYCNTHKSRYRRHGHAQQEEVTKAKLRPYLLRVRQRIANNRENPAWAQLDGNWLALVDIARAELENYRQGTPYIPHQKQALDEIVKLVGSVRPRDVVETVLAVFLMAEEQPRRFRSDDAFRYQLGRRVRALGDMSKGSPYDHRTRKSKLEYRDTAPRATEALALLVEKALGMGSL